MSTTFRTILLSIIAVTILTPLNAGLKFLPDNMFLHIMFYGGVGALAAFWSINKGKE